MWTTLSKVLRLSSGDVVLLGRAWVLLHLADRAIRRRPYAQWPAWMRQGVDSAHAKDESGDSASAEQYTEHRTPDRALQVARLIRLSEIAARYHYRPMNCLRRCLAQHRLLAEQGIVATVHFGARRGDEGLAAHSWLTVKGRVVNDSEDVVERYATLDSAAVIPQPELFPAR